MTISPFLKDLAERVLWTAVQAGTANYLVTGSIDAVQTAVIAAVFSLLKGVAAARLARKGTAQLGVTTYSAER